MNAATESALLRAAESRFVHLVSSGVDEDIACDRVWDCYERAFGENDQPLADQHDKLFENQLQAIVQKGIENA